LLEKDKQEISDLAQKRQWTLSTTGVVSIKRNLPTSQEDFYRLNFWNLVPSQDPHYHNRHIFLSRSQVLHFRRVSPFYTYYAW
jgi:hypothetical protein